MSFGGTIQDGRKVDQPGAAEQRADPLAPSSDLLATAASPRPGTRWASRDALRWGVLLLADTLALAVSALVTLAVGPGGPADEQQLLLTAIPMWLLLNWGMRLYERDANRIHRSTLDEMPLLAASLLTGMSLVLLSTPLVGRVDLGHVHALAFLATAVVLVPSARALGRRVVRELAEPERAVILGSGTVAAMVARKIRAHPELAIDLVGLVDVGEGWHEEAAENIDPVGDIDELAAICRQLRAERLIIAFSSACHEDMLDVVRLANRLHLRVSIVPRLFEVIGSQVETDHIEGLTLLGLPCPGRSRFSLAVKRAIDVVGSVAGLVVLALPMAVIAAAIKVTSPGPVLFRQQRVGRGNRVFSMLKFRTMVDGADRMKHELLHLNEVAPPMFKILDDPRLTPLGRLLRRWHLDELPQLLNVLRGDMSLVGPRPLVPQEDGCILGAHRVRLDITPGLTGPWQVLGGNAMAFDEMVKLDYLYVTNWAVWTDIKLLLHTAAVAVRGKGW